MLQFVFILFIFFDYFTPISFSFSFSPISLCSRSRYLHKCEVSDFRGVYIHLQKHVYMRSCIKSEPSIWGYRADNDVLGYQEKGFIPCALFQFWITQIPIPIPIPFTVRRRAQIGYKVFGDSLSSRSL
jgi:hypothetical protein